MNPGNFKRRITLVKPGARKVAEGAQTRRQTRGPIEYLPETRIPVWASWKHISGTEQIGDQLQFSTNRVECVFWYTSKVADLNNGWYMEDTRGTKYNITSVIEVGGERNQLMISAEVEGVRREGLNG